MPDIAWGLAGVAAGALLLLVFAIDALLDKATEIHHLNTRIDDLQADLDAARRRQCMHLINDTPTWVGPRPSIPTQRQGGDSA